MERSEAKSPKPAAGSARVLVVDDRADLRRAFVRVLSKVGHVLTEAPDARTAIELVQNSTFDLVVSDVGMPDMNGIELLRAFREIDPDLPVLLISGAPDLETAMKAIEYGAVEYLTKPIEFDKLCASVERAFEIRRTRLQAKAALEHLRSGEQLRRGSSRNDPTESWSGALLDGRYRVGAVIGQGGMGTVYDAVREDLAHMRVAIKILHGDLADDKDYLARFRREAETVAAIGHPNIVRILDFKASDGEPAFLVMERLEGGSLSQIIAQDGPLPVERVAFVASQVLAALAAAHRVQIIHRDLKPDNVFLTSISGMRDIVKLLDFGVAKLLGSPGDQKLTQTGVVLGTPAYMAPEQARGMRVDARADLYAVGLMMYEALTGRAPFVAENYNALLFAIQESEPFPLLDLRPDVDLRLAAIITRAMAKDLNLRFQNADAMADAIEPWTTPSSSVQPKAAALGFAPTLLPAREDAPTEFSKDKPRRGSGG
ncbi:MAG TPA: protein kinase [Polyangiaceae bacterium]|jgi:CheY-like chemotaxis protein